MNNKRLNRCRSTLSEVSADVFSSVRGIIRTQRCRWSRLSSLVRRIVHMGSIERLLQRLWSRLRAPANSYCLNRSASGSQHSNCPRYKASMSEEHRETLKRPDPNA